MPFTIAAWAGTWYLTDRIIELVREVRWRNRQRRRGFRVIVDRDGE